jgi:hypothetical protein
MQYKSDEKRGKKFAANAWHIAVSCGFHSTFQRATRGEISNYFQTTVAPQFWQYARCVT